jgi:hypothetical protein
MEELPYGARQCAPNSVRIFGDCPESVKFLNNDHQKAPQHQQISIILEIKWRSPVR